MQKVSDNAHNACAWQQDQMWCEWKAHVQTLRHALQYKISDLQIQQLINECMALYRATCTAPPSMDNLLASISGQNSSLLEAAFMWLGGWRPTSAITLAYSKMGLSVGKSDGLADLITQSCMLSKAQLAAMEALQEQTRIAETEISGALASLQMLVADQNMAEAIGIGNPSNPRSICDAQRLMENKLASLHTLYMQATRLRLQTLQELQNLLTPMQAAQCVVAAFELAYAMRRLGTTPPFRMVSG